MDDWWDGLEGEILERLNQAGMTTPDELGRRLGIPEAAMVSLLTILAQEGKIRLCLVERAEPAYRPRGRDDG